jgi:RNA polymerase sigma factor (sigma-70 family)
MGGGAERDGFARFLAGLYPQLVASMSVYTATLGAAEDIAQDALAVAWQRRERVEVLRDPKTWVYKVAINRSRSLHRRAVVELRHRAHPHPRLVEGDALEEGIRVRSAVQGLPRRQREVIALRYFSDLSVEETAEVMACAAGTVKALTSQAMASLRTRLLGEESS